MAPHGPVPHTSPQDITGAWSGPVAYLVKKAGEGDPGAWQELVARFGAVIAATGRRYRLRPADLAELQQTTWLRLVENLHRIEQPERVGAWLAATARRESLALLRRSGTPRTARPPTATSAPGRPPGNGCGPLEGPPPLAAYCLG
ncbi:MAG: RNA polymerase sigma factor [Acidimicrobiales bacterium]